MPPSKILLKIANSNQTTHSMFELKQKGYICLQRLKYIQDFIPKSRIKKCEFTFQFHIFLHFLLYTMVLQIL